MKKEDWHNLKRQPEFQEYVKDAQMRADHWLQQLASGAAFHQPEGKPGCALWVQGVIEGMRQAMNPEIEEEKLSE